VEILLEAHVADESLLDPPAIARPATNEQPIIEKPGIIYSFLAVQNSD
jgi:hypothetical protein